MASRLVRDVKEVIRRLRNRGISFDGNRQYPAVPTIDDSIESHTNALRAMREAMETHERRNPKATLDSFVRLYELEDVLGGFQSGETGTDYSGQNLGTGSQVYKTTDTAVSPRLHVFRTVIGEDGIEVTQDDNHVIIGMGGGGNTNPSAGEVTSAELSCGQFTTLTPATQLTGIQAGDLIVWVTVMNMVTTYTSDAITTPAGWTLYYWPKYIANEDRTYTQSVWYKFADGADLNPATTHTITLNTSAIICSYAFVFRNAHPQRPLSGLVESAVDGWYPVVPGFTDQPVIAIYQLKGSSPTFTPGTAASINVGEAPTTYYQKTLNDPYFGYRKWFIGSRTASISNDENWIVGETPTSSMGGAGWTYFGLVNLSFSNGSRYFSAQNSSGRHYAEYTVNLIAGRNYLFALNNYYPLWNSAAPNDGIGMTFVAPSNVERGYLFRNIGQPTTTIDPVGDLNTTWWIKEIEAGSSGVTSEGGSRKILMFTATETGAYKLRINGISNSIASAPSLTFTGTETEGWRVNSIQFREGWFHPYPVYTPTSAVIGGSNMGHLHLWGWRDATWAGGFSVWGGGGGIQIAFAINPAWEELPQARMISTGGSTGLIGGNMQPAIGSDGTTLYESTMTFNNTAGAAATTEVYPTLYNERQSYYYEVTPLTATNSNIGFGFRPVMSGTGKPTGISGEWAYWNLLDNVLGWPDGTTTSLSAGTSTIGTATKLGAEIDFLTPGYITFRFYKNGVVVGTKTFDAASSVWNANEPWVATVYNRWWHYYVGQRLSVNLVGPFAYPPNGSIEYDAVGTPATPLPTLTSLTSIGSGLTLVGGTSEAPTVKSLVEGSGIDLVASPGDITISVDRQDVLNGISTTQGSLLYRNATTWVALNPGTAGQVLTTAGSSANPSWTTQSVDTQAVLNAITTTQGSILYRNSANWVALAPGTSGQVLTTAGTSANPSWTTPSGDTISPDAVPSSPNTLNDEFNSGSVLAAKWVEMTSASSGTPTSQTVANGNFIALTSTSSTQRSFMQNVTLDNFRFRAKVRLQNLTLNAWDGNPRIGMFFGRQFNDYKTAVVYEYNSGHTVGIRRTNALTFTSMTSTPLTGLDFAQLASTGLYLEMEYALSTDLITARASLSGIQGTFVTIASLSSSSYMGNAPSTVGIEYASNGATTSMAFMIDWFRRVA